MDIAQLLLLINGDSAGAQAALAEVAGATDAVGASAGRTNSALGLLKGFVVTAGLIGAAMTGLGAISVHMAADFQTQMEMVHTQAGAAQSEVDSLNGAVLRMAGEVGLAPTTLAEGLYHVESAGFRGAQALDMVRKAAELAQIGGSNFEDTAQAMVGTIAAFGDEGVTASNAAALLNAIVGTGDMRMQQLAAAISTGILPSARNFGLSLTDVGAALATLTDNVTPADEAATRLRMTFSLLGAPSEKANKELEKIGLSGIQLAEDMHKPNGLLLVVGELKNALAKTFGPEAADSINHYGDILKTQGVDAANAYAEAAGGAAETLSHAFGGGRTSAAILTLIGEFDRFQSKYKAIEDGSHTFEDAWKSTLGTFNSQWDRVTAAAQAFGIVVGNYLLPYVTPLFKSFADFASGNLGQNVVDLFKSIAGMDTGSGLSIFVANVFGVETSNRITGTLHAIGDTIDAIRQAVPHILEAGGAITSSLLPALESLIPSPLLDIAKAIAQDLSPALKWMSDHHSEVATGLELIAGGFVAIKVATAVSNVLGFVGGVRDAFLVLSGMSDATAAKVGLGWGLTAARVAAVWAVAAAKSVASFASMSLGLLVSDAKAVAGAIASAATTAGAWIASAASSTATWLGWKAFMLLSWVENAAKAIASAAVVSAAWVASSAAAIASWLAAGAVATAQAALTAAKWVIASLAMWAVQGATLAYTAAQWLLNIALDANPIGLVVLAIAALVGGFILLYQHNQAFRDLVNGLWDDLKRFGSWLQATLGPIFDGLGQTAQNLGNDLNAINPWAKHSPSLVENVQTGTDTITYHYRQMARSVQHSLGAVGMPEVGGGVGAGGGGGRAGAGAGGPMAGWSTEKIERLLTQAVEALNLLADKQPAGGMAAAMRTGS